MKAGKYEYLRKKYPEYISKVQMYKICKISPLSATHLLSNGIIPCIDSGSKTWRYKIALSDVINYLQKRDKFGSMIPRGAVTSRKGAKEKSSKKRILGDEREFREYFEFIFSEYPSIICRRDIQEMTGLSKDYVLDLIRDNKIRSIDKGTGKYLITKKALIEFAISPRYIDCHSNSELFRKILGGFEIWKNAKSLP